MNELEIFKKRLIYRSNYRGRKEMDILLSKFVKKYIDRFDETQLNELDKFLDFQDDVILNYYHHGIVEQNIDKNKISKIFKEHLV
jgi:antitoxin CptB